MAAGGFVVALLVYAATVRAHPREMWSPIDLNVYREGARAARSSPELLYRAGFGPLQLPFIYPPFAAMVMWLVASLRFEVLTRWTAIVSIAALVFTIWWSFGIGGQRRGPGRLAATLALSAVALWLEPVQGTLSFGQINLLVMALVVADLALDDGRRAKGVLIGLATGLKLTPAVFVAYLWFTGRKRAALVALGTFAATVMAGFVWAPATARAYWTGGFLVGNRVGQGFLGNQSLNGVAQRAAESGAAAAVAWLAGAIVFGAGGLYLAVMAAKRGEELLGMVLTAGTALVVSPISWTHHYVWVAPLLVLLTVVAWERRSWLVAATAGAVTLLTVAWNGQLDVTGAYNPSIASRPIGLIWRLPHTGGRELTWHGLQLVAGNAYVLATMALIALGAWHVRPKQPPRLAHQKTA